MPRREDIVLLRDMFDAAKEDLPLLLSELEKIISAQ